MSGDCEATAASKDARNCVLWWSPTATKVASSCKRSPPAVTCRPPLLCHHHTRRGRWPSAQQPYRGRCRRPTVPPVSSPADRESLIHTDQPVAPPVHGAAPLPCPLSGGLARSLDEPRRAVPREWRAPRCFNGIFRVPLVCFMILSRPSSVLTSFIEYALYTIISSNVFNCIVSVVLLFLERVRGIVLRTPLTDV